MNGQATTPAIEFREVSISFDDVPALQNVSFVLNAGEMICITGDSCSGKSVLLRLTLGLLRCGRHQADIRARQPCRRLAARLFARPCRADGLDGRGLRDPVAGDRRL